MNTIEDIIAEANQLLREYGLWSQGWRAEADNGKRRAGVCRYAERQIGLSRHILPNAPYAEVRETILHEIAHALTPGHNHDHVWRSKLISMGGTGKRTHDMETPKGRYEMHCENCGVVGYRHQAQGAMKSTVNRPERSLYTHRRCGGKIWLVDSKDPRQIRAGVRVAIPEAAQTIPTREVTAGQTLCQCGCFAPTKGGTFLPGHDAKLLSVLRMEVSLEWAAHVDRTMAAISTIPQHDPAGQAKAATEAENDPTFKNALRAAHAKIPAGNTKLSAKFSTWIEGHKNWESYLARQQARGN